MTSLTLLDFSDMADVCQLQAEKIAAKQFSLPRFLPLLLTLDQIFFQLVTN